MDERRINDWVRIVGEWAESKGWNDKPREFGDWCALFHSEISEAYESYRNAEEDVWIRADGKLEGRAVELVDCLIRIFHWFAIEEINLEEVLKRKHEYNVKRPYRHGNKVQ